MEIPFSTYHRYSNLCVKGKRAIDWLFTEEPKYRKRIFMRSFDIFHKHIKIVYNFLFAFVCVSLCGSVADFLFFCQSHFPGRLWHMISICREKT